MKLQGAIIKEQGVTFAIVIVNPHLLNNQQQARDAQTGFARFFPGLPIILMAQNSSGVPTYYGRKDIVRFLSGIYFERIPWKEYTFAA